MSNLITPKEALHQSSWEVISKRFDLDDISTTRSLLEEAHRIILEQDMIVDTQEVLLKKYEEQKEDLAYQLKGANFLAEGEFMSDPIHISEVIDEVLGTY